MSCQIVQPLGNLALTKVTLPINLKSKGRSLIYVHVRIFQ